MTPQVFHDTLGMFTKGLPVMIGAVAMVVLGTLLWSESSSSTRPEGCARQPRSPRARWS